MKIATRLKLVGIISAAVVTVVGAVLFATTAQVRAELAKNEAAGEVLNAVTALRYLTLEYVLRREPRVQAQWEMRNASLLKLLSNSSTFNRTDSAGSINDLRATYHSVSKLFALLVSTRQMPNSDAREAAVAQELESRLTGQITSKTQTMIADALELSERSRAGVLAAQQREIVAVLAFAGVVLLLIVASTLVTLRSLVRPLERLHEGTATVGGGNLDFSLGVNTQDELGELARAFDGMTEKLKRTTVSRNELTIINAALQAEMVVRKDAELKTHAQLGRLNLLHQITRSIGERQDLRSIFQVVIRCLEDQLQVDFCCICLYDHARGQMVVSTVGLRSEVLAQELGMQEHARIAIDENGLSRCVQGHLVYEPDISDVGFPFPQRLSRGGLAAVVLAPMLVENTVFGVMVTARRPAHSFSSGECEFLRQLSEHVALASNQTELYAALQRAYEDMRQTQKSAMQQERLRALGQMASGIAHDINNAISPVSLYTESLLETEPNLSERTRSSLEVVKRAIDDVSATVARMREFYRQREPQMSLAAVDLNVLAQQIIDLTRARWSDMPQQRGIVIDLRADFEAQLPPVLGVESEIREALTNLVFNAVDAMPDGGTLTVRTSSTAPAAGAPRMVHIEVGDSGVGMDEDTRRRCLEPFFTTKGERGTGLGLAMVYGAIERHNAQIDIDTAPGRGTIMRLMFTLPDGVADAPPAAGLPHVLAPQTILAVDDDPLVLRALRSALEGDGHSVVTADGGQNGIDVFHAALARGQPFNVVITDLGMPYVDGRKVAAAIKALAPGTPIILLTGWGQRIVAEGDLPVHVDRVLAKPPKLADLREALAGCVDQHERVA
ncbi:MAG: ATP-binding protein [Pseudomonadota bacterium]